ncbi:MAG: FHA domain-containing protein [Eubacterium sp.]|nr:FHA domain-containing protein [Eubacterium sp.]
METQYYDTMGAGRAGSNLNLLIVSVSDGIQDINLKSFNKSRLVLGRDPSSCDIVINSPVISGTHVRLKLEHGQVFLGDMNSTNGTYVFKSGSYHKLQPQRYMGPLRVGEMLLLGSKGNIRAEGKKESILVIVTNGDDRQEYKRFPVFDDEYVIGRSKECDIVLDHPAVTRRHARVYKKDNRFYIEDMDSANGVFVNGIAVRGLQEIHEKDLIQIGGSLIIFSCETLICKTKTDGIQLSMLDLVKRVDHGKKMILSHVNCTIDSNDFVAIVGGSGAGKSTLLKTLGGYDKFYEGDVFYNGISLKQNYNVLKNIIGYVPQEDIVFENLSLKKMLYYTAKMKMPDNISPKEITDRINEVLRLVELSEHQNTMIRNLSGGQKKRASIAVELLADPGMFFLDEPTSGLDPGTEQKLMRVLNRLSKTQGKTIVMVTHTTQSLDLCDKIIFMGKKGTLAFMGTPEEAKMFFGVDSLIEIYNLLEEDTETWARQFDQFNPPVDFERSMDKEPVKKPKRKSAIRQLFTLTRRYGELVINDLPRLGLLLIQPILIAILIKIVSGDDVFEVFEPTKQILFTFSCSGIWIGIFNTIQEVCKERPIVKREYMSNLRLTTYILSKYLVQFVISLVQTLVFVGLFALLMGNLPSDGVILPCFLEIFITMWLTIYSSSALGLLVSSVMKNGDRAMAVSPFLLIIQLLFSGILFSLKGASEIISYFTVSRWSVEGLGNVVDLNSLRHMYQQIEYKPDDLFRHGADHLMQTWGILLLFIVVLAAASILFLRNVSKDR